MINLPHVAIAVGVRIVVLQNGQRVRVGFRLPGDARRRDGHLQTGLQAADAREKRADGDGHAAPASARSASNLATWSAIRAFIQSFFSSIVSPTKSTLGRLLPS